MTLTLVQEAEPVGQTFLPSYGGAIEELHNRKSARWSLTMAQSHSGLGPSASRPLTFIRILAESHPLRSELK